MGGGREGEGGKRVGCVDGGDDDADEEGENTYLHASAALSLDF